MQAYRERMGWRFTWVSSLNNTFNYDFNVSATDEQIAAGTMQYNYRDGTLLGSESHGISVFERDVDGDIYHTCSSYARGLDRMNGAYGYLDTAPLGRNEDDLPFGLAWVKRHEEY